MVGGRDYGPFPTRTLTLPATIPVNSSDFRFPINIRDNNIVEDPRTFRVSLAIQGEDLTAVGQLPGRSSIVTIADDDCKYARMTSCAIRVGTMCEGEIS